MAAAGKAWIGWALAVVAADQLTKLAIESFTPEHWERTLIPGLLGLVHRHNPGAAFGLLAGTSSRWVSISLLLFSVAAVAVLGWLLATGRAGGCLARAGLALVLGGAAGNGIDRAVHGGVIDFVDLHAGPYHWPAFNVADAAIVIGAGLVILEMFTSKSVAEGGKA
jgi:signal peptidase II